MYDKVGVPEQALHGFPLGLGLVVQDEPFELSCRREALQKWKQSNGAAATYNNLIGVFERAGYRGYADTVRSIFASGE